MKKRITVEILTICPKASDMHIKLLIAVNFYMEAYFIKSSAGLIC